MFICPQILLYNTYIYIHVYAYIYICMHILVVNVYTHIQTYSHSYSNNSEQSNVKLR